MRQSAKSSRLLLFLLVGSLAVAMDLLASHLLDPPPSNLWLRILAALIPLPGDLALIAMAVSAVRRLDDFQQRVQFEAVTIAFLATGVALFIDSFLQKAGVVGQFRPGSVWLFMLVFYGIGYLLAIRHYR